MYQWVKHNGCIGRIINAYPWWLLVKWLVADRPFDKQPFESFYSSGMVLLSDEPRLTAVLAAQYLGVTRQRIYQLNKEGVFGEVRNPFWVLPSELDTLKHEERQVAA